MDADLGKMLQRVGNLGELDPVVLDVLPRGEMTIAAIVLTRDMSQCTELLRRQGAVRNRDPQHVSVELQVDAVHQPERLEFVFRQFTGEPARDLIAKLRNTFVDDGPVEFVVSVHHKSLAETCLETVAAQAETRRSMVTPCWRIFSRKLPGWIPSSPISTGAI